MGNLEPLDAILHTDAGWECQHTYEARAWYSEWFRQHGVRVEIIPSGDIRREAAEEHIHIPFYTVSGAPLNRQCTRHFKVTPAKRVARQLVGYHATKPPPPPPGSIEQWLGFTLDEYHRLKDSRVQFIVHRFPLVEKRMLRQDCIDYLQSHGLPAPSKSACVCCPFRSAREWLDMRENRPDEWTAAVEFDQANRDNPLAQRGATSSGQLFVYKFGGPLKDADLEADVERERADAAGFQMPLLCGDGPCWT